MFPPLARAGWISRSSTWRPPVVINFWCSCLRLYPIIRFPHLARRTNHLRQWSRSLILAYKSATSLEALLAAVCGSPCSTTIFIFTRSYPSCSNSDFVVLPKSGSLDRASSRARHPIGRILTRAPAFHFIRDTPYIHRVFSKRKTEYNMYITSTLNQI